MVNAEKTSETTSG